MGMIPILVIAITTILGAVAFVPVTLIIDREQTKVCLGRIIPIIRIRFASEQVEERVDAMLKWLQRKHIPRGRDDIRPRYWALPSAIRRSRLMPRLAAGIRFRRFDIRLRIGTADAAWTALLTGAVRIILGSMGTWLTANFRVKDIILDVVPDFQKKVFEIQADCIVSTRIVHIILILTEIFKIKGAIENGGKNGRDGKYAGYSPDRRIDGHCDVQYP
ncbi:MAG TPA: hypothetical protein DD727_00430 [Clostridiales bacterium]|nr:hypothetical protein [Clostridiales bacterium]